MAESNQHLQFVRELINEDAYNTQNMGISAKSFTDKLAIPLYSRIVTQLEKLKSDLIEGGEDKDKIDEAFENKILPYLFHSENGKLHDCFAILEDYLARKYFHVPAHVVLPEDACHKKSAESSCRNEDLETENNRLFEEILAEKQKSVHLSQQLTELRKTKEKMLKVRANILKLQALVD